MTNRKLHSLYIRVRRAFLLPFFPFFCQRIRDPKRIGIGSLDTKTLQPIIDGLKTLGIPIEEFEIDVAEFQQYFEKAEYKNRYPKYYPAQIIEKSLEHFLAQKFLSLHTDDVYIDIASQGSPAPEIYQRLFGCKTYAQDLDYMPGVHGNKIGSNAAALPLPEGFASKMALHCSFEHFEENSDIDFIHECGRVLAPSGKAIIVPLYLNPEYAVLTDPLVSGFKSVPFESDAVVICVRNWNNRHGRQYDPEHLNSRIFQPGHNLHMQVIFVKNYQEVDPACYARFALVIQKI